MKKLVFLPILLVLSLVVKVEASERASVAALTIPYFSKSEATIGLDTSSATATAIEHKADSLTQLVIRENRLVGLLDATKSYTLPLGIQKEVGGVKFIIVLDELRLLPNRAVLKAYLRILIPESGKTLSFYADEVTIGPDGIDAAKLRLFKDVPLPLLGKDILLKKWDTFVEWDCNGYKSTSLAGEMTIKNENIIPKSSKGQDNTRGGSLKAAVSATFTNVNDILFSISLGAFEIKGLNDFIFTPGEVYVDMSDSQNPSAAKFPTGYTTSTMATPGEFTWRGVYIKRLSVELPKTFSKNAKPTTLLMTDMLIDDCGFTGNLSATEVIPKQGGQLGGWPFSISKISIGLYKNHVDVCSFEGAIKAGFIKTKEDINYKARFDNGNFFLSASLPGDVKFDAIGARVNLSHNSTICVDYVNGDYLPKLVLQGYMTIDTSSLKLGRMDFQDLEISTVAPYVKFSYISVTSGSSGGFPLQLKKLAFTSKDSILKMQTEITLNLAGEGDGGFAGTGGFTITAVNKGGRTLDYKYKSFKLDKLEVAIVGEAYEIKGSLTQYQDHPVFGNGFRGEVRAAFIPGVAGGAVAQFGSVKGMRYWYADAFIKLGTPIVVGTGLGIQAFGGGAYQHMKVLKLADLTAPTDTTVKSDTLRMSDKDMDNFIAKYVPDSTVGFGIKASVMLVAVPTADVFNGMVTLEATFNTHGGLAYLGLFGDLNFMKPPGTPAEGGNGISAKMRMEYFVTEKTFSGQVDVYVNVAGVFVGAHEKNRAGTALLFFSPKDWYVFIGTPEDRIALKMMKLAQTDSYFMVGTQVGDIPPLPKELTSILGQIDFTQSRNGALLSKGGGFAFGASFKLDTGEQSFAIFYGSFSLGAGFDILLRDFGDARCVGRSGPIGVNGWYAKGQLYAWLKAEIGVKVKVFRKKKKFNILSIGGAAVFAAQLPNPVYLKGIVGGRYSVLGGMVKGNCRFELTVGEKCEIMGASAVENIAVISEITPTTGTTEANVFTLPQVAFNMPVNKVFQLMDIDDKVKNFRIALDYFRVTDNGQPIKCRENWNDQSDVLALEPFNILPGKKELKVEAKVHFEVQENGQWKNYLDSVGGVETESKLVVIKTGEAPDYLPASNVAVEYPANRMLNFYREEYPEGYVVLKQGMPYLFQPEAGWKKRVRFTSLTGEVESDIAYSEAEKRVFFKVPRLDNQTVYTMDIVKVPLNAQSVKADSNLVKVAQVQAGGDTLTTNTLEGNISKASEKKLYSLDFRTSMYNTFAKKAEAMVNPSRSRHWVYSTVHNFTFSYSSSEPFDKYDAQHVVVSADIYNTTWYKDVLDRSSYGYYPIKPELTVDWRAINATGPAAAPTRAIELTSVLESLSDGDIQTKSFTYSSMATDFYFMLGVYAYKDRVDLKNKAAYYLYKYPTDNMVQELYRSVYYSIYEFRPYYLKADYTLPGLNKITSSPLIRFDL